MVKHAVAICVLLIFGFPVMSQAQSHMRSFPARPPLVTIPDSAIESNIDADITGSERSLIANVMKHLRPENRVNVLYFDANGHIYSNHRSVLAKAHRWLPISGNTYVDDTGHKFVGPPELPRPTDFTPGNPTAYAGRRVLAWEPLALSDLLAQVTPSGGGTSGPYRRVYSVPNFSYFNGYVSIPCSPSNIPIPGTETGYVYSGGWSPNGNSVDGGFQYSQTYDNWALFVKEQGVPQVDASSSRYDCGQDIYLQFYPGSPGNVTAAASGYISGVLTQLSATAAATSDWTPEGTNVVLKRMTTIAQNQNSFNDGTYFEYDPVNIVPMAHWWNSRLGYYSDASLSWPDQVWDAASTGGYQRWPDDSTKVIVNYVNSSEETDGIDLHS